MKLDDLEAHDWQRATEATLRAYTGHLHRANERIQAQQLRILDDLDAGRGEAGDVQALDHWLDYQDRLAALWGRLMLILSDRQAGQNAGNPI